MSNDEKKKIVHMSKILKGPLSNLIHALRRPFLKPYAHYNGISYMQRVYLYLEFFFISHWVNLNKTEKKFFYKKKSKFPSESTKLILILYIFITLRHSHLKYIHVTLN